MENAVFTSEEVTKICNIIKCIYDRNLPFCKFTEEFFYKLKNLVYFDKSDFMFYKFDEGTGYYEMQHFRPINWSQKEIHDYENEHMHNDDVLPILAQPEYIAFRNSDIFSLTGRRKTDYFQQFANNASLEISIDANIPLSEDSDVFAIIGLFRSLEKVEFSLRDLAIIKMLQPHLSERIKRDVLEYECIQLGACEGNYRCREKKKDKGQTADAAFENIDTFGIGTFSLDGNIISSNASFSAFCKKYGEGKCNPMTQAISKYVSTMASKGLVSLGPLPLHIEDDTFMLQLNYTDARREYITAALHYTSELFSKRLTSLKHEYNLTNREFEIINLSLKKCMTNAEISQELLISEATVKRHLYTAYQKIGIRNQKQLFQELQMI